MRRPLDVLQETDAGAIPEARHLRVAATVVAVDDVGDGSVAGRFASLLQAAGAQTLDRRNADYDILVVLESPTGPNRRRRDAEQLRSSATVVLGSPRPAFAWRMVESLLGDR